MQRLDILLRRTLEPHTAQTRAPQRLGDRQRIVVVVLVAPHQRLDVLRRNQPDPVAQGLRVILRLAIERYELPPGPLRIAIQGAPS